MQATYNTVYLVEKRNYQPPQEYPEKKLFTSSPRNLVMNESITFFHT